MSCSYAEIQVVDEIFDKDAALKMGIDKVNIAHIPQLQIFAPLPWQAVGQDK